MIDILPKQVSKDSPGQYFAVEKYYLKERQLADIKTKHINLVLKLNCYRPISLNEETEVNPPPEKVAEKMRSIYLLIRVDDALILSEPDDTHLTLFDPDEELLELTREIAAGEGLFVWQPPELFSGSIIEHPADR